MTRNTSRHVPAPPPALLRWELQRDANAITCQLDVRGLRSYEVCVMPHWDPSSTVIERYDTVGPALLRHAEVSRRLREIGWTVIDHVAAGGIQPAV